MRELSKQEINNVRGGIPEFLVGLGPSITFSIAQNFQYFIRLLIVVPQFSIIQDYFKKNSSS